MKHEGRKRGDGPQRVGTGRKWEWPGRDKTHMLKTWAMFDGPIALLGASVVVGLVAYLPRTQHQTRRTRASIQPSTTYGYSKVGCRESARWHVKPQRRAGRMRAARRSLHGRCALGVMALCCSGNPFP